MNKLSFQYWVLFTLNMIDVWFTYMIIQQGGSEVNLFVLASINQFGIITGMLIIKLPALFVIGLLIYMHEHFEWTKYDWVQSEMLHLNPHRLLNIGIGIYLLVTIYSFVLLHLP